VVIGVEQARGLVERILVVSGNADEGTKHAVRREDPSPFLVQDDHAVRHGLEELQDLIDIRRWWPETGLPAGIPELRQEPPQYGGGVLVRERGKLPSKYTPLPCTRPIA
jgi:hypothetical protein